MKDLDLGSHENPPNALYFGIGLGTTNGLSRELPLDVIVLILAADKIKEILGLIGVDVLIADEHMKKNGYNEGQIDRISRERRNQIGRICDRLRFDNWGVHLASDVVRTPEYQEVLSRLPFFRNQYLLMELADMEWFRGDQGTDIKLGWTSSATPHDEKWFDDQYRKHLGSGMTFPRTKAGRTVQGKAVPPYSHVGLDSDRLLIRPNEPIEEKIARMPKGVRKYFGHLANMYDGLGFPQPNEVAERVRRLYEAIL